MVGEEAPRRGEIWWAAADKRRPVIVVQADPLNRTAIHWILAVPLTSNLALVGLPGNVRLGRTETGLGKHSVANVGQVAPVPRMGFRERVNRLSAATMSQVDEGLRLVLSL